MKAMFCGTFDPFTTGHAEIVKAAKDLFGEVVVAVAADTGRVAAAPLQTRLRICKASLGGVEGVTVKPFKGLLTDFYKAEHCGVLVRGLRNPGDFIYEQSLAAVYRSQAPDIKSIYLLCAPQFTHISASTVRALCQVNGILDGYVVKAAEDMVRNTYGITKNE